MSRVVGMLSIMFANVRFSLYCLAAYAAIRLRYRVRKSQKLTLLSPLCICLAKPREQKCVSSTSKDLVREKLIITRSIN